MSIINKAAATAFVSAFALFSAGAAQAATYLTVTIRATGSGFIKPDPYNDFDRKIATEASSVSIAFQQLGTDRLFYRNVNQVEYYAQFGEAGLTISTLTFAAGAAQFYPYISAATCYTGQAVAANASYAPTCGSYYLNASFGGGPAVEEFSGSIESIEIVEGDTTGGLGIVYSSVVPEPSTWALMLAGFGMIAYATRRRKVAFA
jgi:hypothetical protein